jgi:hypothetical protein
MPQFKSTYNILKKVDADEVFETSWMDRDQIYLPPKVDWDYQREMKIEDVDIWEVLYHQGGSVGVYAAWMPYAEFYMITSGPDYRNAPMIIDGFQYVNKNIETFYGPEAQKKVFNRAKELGIKLAIYKNWVDNNEMWLYSQQQEKKQIILAK